MSSLSSFRKRFDYHFWAMKQLINCLDDTEGHNPARGYIAHVLTADWIWMQRMNGVSPTTVDVFPQFDVARIQNQLEDDQSSYLAFLESADLSQTAQYTNMSGVAYESTFKDILDHVLLHGMYHRGQVAAALRESGTKPPSTDYIYWVRRK